MNIWEMATSSTPSEILCIRLLSRCEGKWPTPVKTNMSPENQWLQDVFPTEIVPF